MNERINPKVSEAGIVPQKIAADLAETWFPRVVGEVNDQYVKVARLQGSLTWHQHDDGDELFYVLSGSLVIQLPHVDISLKAGEMYVVPRGVQHNPIASEECLVLLIEGKELKHTGDVNTDKTRSIEQQLGSKD